MNLGRTSARLVLGCAQLGMPYGRSNSVGLVPEAEAIALVHEAVELGVNDFDTARAYGASEAILGKSLSRRRDVSIVTKLSPLNDLSPDASHTDVSAAVQASLDASAAALDGIAPPRLLLHRAAHRTAYGGAIWDILRLAREKGRVSALGVSAARVEELLESLSDPDVEHVQFPVNILDSRWRSARVLEALRARPDVCVHGRSIFLQGLLLSSAEVWPPVSGVDPKAIIAALSRISSSLGRSDASLCIGFARALPRTDGIVIGVETREQLRRNVAFFREPPIDSAVIGNITDGFEALPDELLDPFRWPVTPS